MNHIQYSELSKTLTNRMDKTIKKNQGIYFTPPKTVYKNLQLLEPYITDIKNVLEPSCGSCEFVLALQQKYQHLDITAIEYNEMIYQSISKDINNVRLLHLDFLQYNETMGYDLIIGNPPYVVIKKEKKLSIYSKYYEGRPNLFILFILKSLTLLHENGILSFILPKNFLNCLYYDKTRTFIYNHFKIIDIIHCEDPYLETSQETILFILQKNKDVSNNEMYSFLKHPYTIFGTMKDIQILKSLYQNSTSLYHLNCKVNVGTIVWNQCKKSLTNDMTKTRLIYSSDIKNNSLVTQNYKNNEKKNYIDKKGSNQPTLVVNRGYGIGHYQFEYCFISGEFEYLIENHLIEIQPIHTMEKNELEGFYQKIIQSFQNPKTQRFIQHYFQNNSINSNELCYILPIYEI
jgi:type I restriction-modification system DNA methylase subunit